MKNGHLSHKKDYLRGLKFSRVFLPEDYQYAIRPDDMAVSGINPLRKCEGKKTCEITVRNWWQHNHGDSDYLIVQYICDPGKKTAKSYSTMGAITAV